MFRAGRCGSASGRPGPRRPSAFRPSETPSPRPGIRSCRRPPTATTHTGRPRRRTSGVPGRRVLRLGGRWLPRRPGSGPRRRVPVPHAGFLSGLPLRTPTAAHARAGRFCYDTMTLVGPGTYTAARAAADAALTAVDLVSAGAPAAYAACRPPGHHATREAFGGSCYLNNAAIAAQALRSTGSHKRVAVVDIDAHHANGTQSIFYDRPDVMVASIHVDPGAGWFPALSRFADEIGRGRRPGRTSISAPPRAPGIRVAGRGRDSCRGDAPVRPRRSGAVTGRGRGRRRPGEPAAGYCRWYRSAAQQVTSRGSGRHRPGGRLPPADAWDGSWRRRWTASPAEWSPPTDPTNAAWPAQPGGLRRARSGAGTRR